jgi:hypothetical protein
MSRTAEAFFDWAYTTRANTVLRLAGGEKISPEKIFLSFCSHDPAFVSDGPAGLNASIKGIGFLPKDEYLEETLAAYLTHIDTYDPEDKTYSDRGLQVLIKYLYGEEARSRVCFAKFGTLEMAKNHSYINYKADPTATVLFYQPPAVSYELRGKIEIYDETESGKREIFQQLINAQHDVYHTPAADRTNWLKRPAYLFRIAEVFDNSATREGFGVKLEYPYR